MVVRTKYGSAIIILNLIKKKKKKKSLRTHMYSKTKPRNKKP